MNRLIPILAVFAVGCASPTSQPPPQVSPQVEKPDNLVAELRRNYDQSAPPAKPPAKPPEKLPEKRAKEPWQAGWDLAESVVVGASYADFEDQLIATPVTQWRRMNRTDFVAGRFAETYRINGDYMSFRVADGRFVMVSR